MTLHGRELNQDVRELGQLLGSIIEAQDSTEAFKSVERIRNNAIAYRRGDGESREPIHDELDRLSPEMQDVVARAFTTYFELINLAEERERVREIREESKAGTSRTPSRKLSRRWLPRTSIRTPSRRSSRTS